MSKLIDLSHTVMDNMPVFPGDLETRLFHVKHLGIDGYNDHRLEIGMHSGTHIDGPMHLTQSYYYINDLPLDLFIGPGCVLDVRNQSLIGQKKEYDAVVQENSIVLLFTGHDILYGQQQYFTDYPVVDINFCKFMVTKKIKMLGLDAPSPDKYPYEAHKYLLSHGIYIIENLTNLGKLKGTKRFEVIALPQKVKADSAIARVAARILN